MTTGTYSLPFYHSAVDGLVIPRDNYRFNYPPKRSFPVFSYPRMPLSSPIRTSYIHPPPSYPRHSNILRSSTGSILHRLPNYPYHHHHHRGLTTTATLRPKNLRWESGINIVDIKSRPLVHQRYSLQDPMMLSSRTKLVRSESLQIPNNPYPQRIMENSELDARYFCGLPPIQENKPIMREIPPFRSTGMTSR